VETIGSKRSYALIWCMPNNDDDDDLYMCRYCTNHLQAQHMRISNNNGLSKKDLTHKITAVENGFNDSCHKCCTVEA